MRKYDISHRARPRTPGAMHGLSEDSGEGSVQQRTEPDGQGQAAFLWLATHELKTPLTAMRLYADLLQEALAEGAPDAPRYLEKIVAQMGRLELLTRDFLDLSRIEDGSLKLSMAYFDFNRMLEEAADHAEALAPRYRIKLAGRCAAPMWGDRERLCQVLMNLLENAVKYSPEHRLVEVATISGAHGVEVSVTDRGVGIPARYHARIFERFFQVRDTPSGSTFPGLGMGLYIAREIIERHGGDITVRSAPAKGSSFTIRLPLATGEVGSAPAG